MKAAAITPSIDPEFRDLCLDTTAHERESLRESLMEEGCREPICVWNTDNYPIVDGHQRHEICTNEGISFDVRLLNFPSRRAVRLWMLRNQLSRRNLTKENYSLLRGRYYSEAKGEQEQPVGRGRACHPPESGGDTTRKRADIAEELGVTERTLKRDRAYSEAAKKVMEKAPELRDAIEQVTIPKSAVEALSDQPAAALKKLAKLQGKPLKDAAKKLAATQRASKPKPSSPAKPKNGQQKNDPRIWKEVEGMLGKSLNRVGVLNEMKPHGNLCKRMTDSIKSAMHTLEEWRTVRV